MSKNMRNSILLCKNEATYGVNPTMTAANNAILARNINPVPANTTFADRNLIQPYFGNTGKVQVQGNSSIEFEFEVAGSGAAGTPPKFGPILQSLGFSETITASTKVDYAPISSGIKSCALEYYLDGIKHVMLGAYGDYEYTLDAAGIPICKAIMTGLVATITDTANPSGADYSGFMPPLAVNKVNTPTFTLHGVSLLAKQFSISGGNQIEYRNYIGQELVAFLDRKPTGNVLAEYPSIATKNWWAASNAGTTGALLFTHGTTAGNIFEASGPKVQVSTQGLQNDNNIAMIPLGLEFLPNVGNDELLFTFK